MELALDDVGLVWLEQLMSAALTSPAATTGNSAFARHRVPATRPPVCADRPVPRTSEASSSSEISL
jgi:hypothetical protein